MYVVVNSIECCCQVKEDEQGGETIINCHNEVIGDLHQGRLCAMSSTEARLEPFVQGVRVEVVLQLSGSSFFQHLGQKREMGDGRWASSLTVTSGSRLGFSEEV